MGPSFNQKQFEGSPWSNPVHQLDGHYALWTVSLNEAWTDRDYGISTFMSCPVTLTSLNLSGNNIYDSPPAAPHGITRQGRCHKYLQYQILSPIFLNNIQIPKAEIQCTFSDGSVEPWIIFAWVLSS
ncbi:hypothetical protein P9112_008060 [Eukaryota sp. TZLM1-RC]